jgi:putative hydrolase of the HAD superfamily
VILDGVECVVFDVDDTLYLERDYVRSGFRAVARTVEKLFEQPEFDTIAWSLFERGVRGDTFERALTEIGISPTPQIIAELVDTYRGHAPTIQMLEDAKLCVEMCAQDRTVAVITDGPTSSQRAKVDALSLPRWSDHIVLTSELGSDFGKPNPHAFRLVADRVGVPHAACAYIADNPAKDFIAPIGLGWRTIRVRRRGSLHEFSETRSAIDVELVDLWTLIPTEP